MAEYSRLAKGNFTAASGNATAIINLPFVPDYVELWNYTNIKTAATHAIARAWWDNKLVDGSNNPTMVELYSGSTTATVFDTIQTNGISTFQGALAQQYGATQQIIGITKASQAVVNVTAHGYNVGDTVIMQGIANGTTNNMQLLNGVPFTIVTVSDANHFTIQWNTNQSAYTAITGSPTGTLVKKVLYPFLYLPQDNVVTAVTTGTIQTVIQTTMYHNLEIGQEVAFRIPSTWGPTGLNSLPNSVIPGSPIYGYVSQVSGTANSVTLDNWTFAVNINSSAFTAFTSNFTMTSSTLAGLSYPQVLAVGDVNNGGNSIYANVSGNTPSTSPLYPPPLFPIVTNRVATINGPAVKGAFVNNTSQGFIIGAGVTNVDANANSAILTPSQANQIYWHAYAHDFANP